MTFGKLLTLNNVLHVADIRKNLVFGSLLSKSGFQIVFYSNKFIFSKSGMFVEKGYLYDDLFKMNDENNNKITSSTYLLQSYDVWHDILGHMNYNYM
jgi:hypothetical protein